MSKAERLFTLVNLLRGRRTAVTARQLAEQLEVSERTIYRDIAALAHSGVPVSGDAGVGYMLAPRTHLPPLMFAHEEALALVIGLKYVRAFTDPELAQAANAAEQRVRAVLTDSIKKDLETLPYRIPVTGRFTAERERHAVIRHAITDLRKLRIDYRNEAGEQSQRIIWPLGLMSWGALWTILAWCETRSAYRNFRLDRILGIDVLDEVYEQREDISISHYFRVEMGTEDPI